MNILLLGKGGQVGWELQRSLAVLGHVTALDHDSTGHCGDFARPDAVFIGGHGGHLEEMIEKVKQVLHPEGCIVFNSVSAESKEAFCRGIERNGMVLHPSTHIALNEYNPIEIMKATLS